MSQTQSKTKTKTKTTQGPYHQGDQWQCECGKWHMLDNPYLIAHWYERMVHCCSQCDTRHTIQAGIVKRIHKAKHKPQSQLQD